ncbi:hypothetical protein FHR99_002759 [Litorivivens lipolytica]|uniref:Quercetin 2,3-dioxygenase n=1 Tax=Litorivivens lipolytica TaxID=1524264 RepID=A0A7W4Z7Y3_9GAMM|nr:pirin family protein [Litorivivens lipolytica]MBB3048485.1 hypothetical protein [Litorivivens lipolytica]
MATRQLQAIYPSRPSRDGDGVRIQRVAPPGQFGILDPFLMLDEIASDDASDYIGGFPEHPHRGFETVTLMLEGRMRHRDHLGNEGVIEAGGVQWMSAARGILHSEMPEQSEGRLHGFQLWLNLPARNKMDDPQYREYQAHDIPNWQPEPGVNGRVIAGAVKGVQGPVQGVATHPLAIDLHISGTVQARIPVSASATVLVYVYEGGVSLPAAGGERVVERGELARLQGGDEIVLKGGGEKSRALVLAAEPLGEPIAHYGPFVMNTAEEIEQAIQDYRSGALTA